MESIRIIPKLIALASDNLFRIKTVRTESVRCGLMFGKHFAKVAVQIIST